jgi:O-methyltransferase
MSYAVDKFKVYLRNHVLPGFLFRWRAALQGVPDANLYSPTFEPWRMKSAFDGYYREISDHTLVSREAAWTLYTLARQAVQIKGDFFEAGVYRGGTARLFYHIMREAPGYPHLHLFDTFAGMPATDKVKDLHHEKDFMDTSLEAVSAFVGKDKEGLVCYYKGLIPQTFTGLENATFAFAHIDVDIYQSIMDCCEYVYPRMNPGGFIVFDDYGVPSCPGARAAVDAFFAGKPEIPLVLHTGQAVVFIGPR